MSGAGEFLKARDFLLTHRADYETAYKGFSWPRLDRFNWALYHFDPMTRGQTRTARTPPDGFFAEDFEYEAK
jgi:acetyl-CoA synthetase